MNAREMVLSVYIAPIGKRTARDASPDAAELCGFANSINHSNEIACNSGRRERQERASKTHKP